jgi:hypothetical protein
MAFRPDSDAPPYNAHPCRHFRRPSQGRKNLRESNCLGKLQSRSGFLETLSKTLSENFVDRGHFQRNFDKDRRQSWERFFWDKL